jgi:hypothetical protein
MGYKESNPGLTMDEFWVQSAIERGIPLGRVGEAQEAKDLVTILIGGSTSSPRTEQERRIRSS